MRRSVRYTIVAIVILMISAHVIPAEGKYVDHTPDLTSDVYWDCHHIAVVHVTEIGKSEAGKEQLTFEVTQWITKSSSSHTRTVPLAHFWFGRGRDEEPDIEKDDLLVVFIEKKGHSQIAAVKLDMPPNESPLVKRLERIAQLRANVGGIEALSEGSFDDDAKLALYCLKRLSTSLPVEIKDYSTRLRDLRQKEAVDVHVRLMASALACKLEGESADSDEEYTWLRLAIEESNQTDWAQVAPLARRLLDFKKKRLDNVAFFSRIVQDKKKPLPIRIAARGVLDDPRLFVFSSPDDASAKIFDTCISMLQDPLPDMRRAGSHLISNLCHYLAISAPPKVSREYIHRATTSMVTAVSVETDETCLFHMKIYLEQISDTRITKP